MVPVAGCKHVRAGMLRDPAHLGIRQGIALHKPMDITLLFSTRIIRLFCYGFLSVVLALYLSEAGLTEGQIGLLFTLTLAGDALISLWLTTAADRCGRRRRMVLGAFLMAGAGVAFVMTRNVT